jgi:hypothetical protein
MIKNKPESEIWSEYPRIKNEIMDYDANLREAIADIRMLMRMGVGGSRVRLLFAKAQKHVSLILDIARKSRAIPPDSNQQALLFIEGVSKGNWRTIEDFEECQKFFTDSFIKTRLYDITIEKQKMLAPHEV